MIKTPQGVRINNRYRGPQESKKINSMYSQFNASVKKLNNIINELGKSKDIIKEKPKNIESICTSINSTINSIENTFDSIVNYEVNK